MGFVKVSLLLFYRRIFVTRSFLRSNNILIGLVTSFTLAVLLVRKVSFDWRNATEFFLGSGLL